MRRPVEMLSCVVIRINNDLLGCWLLFQFGVDQPEDLLPKTAPACP